jgi:hypothetical protein
LTLRWVAREKSPMAREDGTSPVSTLPQGESQAGDGFLTLPPGDAAPWCCQMQ